MHNSIINSVFDINQKAVAAASSKSGASPLVKAVIQTSREAANFLRRQLHLKLRPKNVVQGEQSEQLVEIKPHVGASKDGLHDHRPHQTSTVREVVQPKAPAIAGHCCRRANAEDEPTGDFAHLSTIRIFDQGSKSPCALAFASMSSPHKVDSRSWRLW